MYRIKEFTGYLQSRVLHVHFLVLIHVIAYGQSC